MVYFAQTIASYTQSITPPSPCHKGSLRPWISSGLSSFYASFVSCNFWSHSKGCAWHSCNTTGEQNLNWEEAHLMRALKVVCYPTPFIQSALITTTPMEKMTESYDTAPTSLHHSQLGEEGAFLIKK